MFVGELDIGEPEDDGRYHLTESQYEIVRDRLHRVDDLMGRRTKFLSEKYGLPAVPEFKVGGMDVIYRSIRERSFYEGAYAYGDKICDCLFREKERLQGILKVVTLT
tara:strand:+ start:1711 stop:2031 length:321 start_codon:yes stop_codon:yes gene_type:complete